MVVSVYPVQQARWPAPPQAAGCTQIPEAYSKPPLEPPQTQAAGFDELHVPGICTKPSSQAKLLLANSPSPLQQARWPALPQEVAW
jgi:hypothetical protein